MGACAKPWGLGRDFRVPIGLVWPSAARRRVFTDGDEDVARLRSVRLCLCLRRAEQRDAAASIIAGVAALERSRIAPLFHRMHCDRLDGPSTPRAFILAVP